MKTDTQTKHAESGCTDYLQHPWESCPENPHLNKTWSNAHCNDFGQPATNKAQHSPEWICPTCETFDLSCPTCREHDHADKLGVR